MLMSAAKWLIARTLIVGRGVADSCDSTCSFPGEVLDGLERRTNARARVFKKRHKP
jgi:hypothetical protein